MSKTITVLNRRMAKEERGSTFIMVLLIIAVLSILGSVLLAATTANYMQSMSYLKTNSAFYNSDGVMEKVLYELENVSISAQLWAKDYVERHLEDYADECREIDELTGESYVNHHLLEEKVLAEYQQAYKEYIINDDGTLPEKLRYKLNTLGIREKGTLGYEDNYFDFLDPPDSLTLSVKVSRNAGDPPVYKKIEAEFEFLNSPDQIVIESVVKKDTNPIWQRALTTEKDLVAVEGQVTLSAGDNSHMAVYALGTVPAKDNSPGDEYGGIVAGLDNLFGIDSVLSVSSSVPRSSGKIAILGNAFTNGYIHTFNSSSSILINNTAGTDVFAQSVQTEWSSFGSTVSINGNAKLSDDLEVNGIQDTITIGGTLYGFSTGDLNRLAYNQSSSILYNDPSYTSKIRIDGRLYIGGLAYVESLYKDTGDTSNPNLRYAPYQTGESLSIGKNFYAYTYPLTSEETLDALWKYRTGAVPAAEDPSYPMYSGVVGAGGPNDAANLRILRFMDYVRAQASDAVTFASQIQKGGADASGYIMVGGAGKRVEGYALGALPVNGSVYMPNFVEAENPDYTAAGIKQFHTYDSEGFHFNNAAWKSQYINASYITGRSRTGALKSGSEFPLLTRQNEVALNIDKQRSNVLLRMLNTKDGSENLTLDLSGTSYKGLIYSDGDIYIYAGSPFTFTGSIIAKGKIVFWGGGEKTITYDENAVKEALALDPNGYAFFSKGLTETTDPGDMVLTTQATRNVIMKNWKEIK